MGTQDRDYSRQRKVNTTYLLELHLSRSRIIKIGRLGSYRFSKGNYIYVGSAQKNFHQRITRHLRKEKKTYWHIDYLLRHARVTRVYSCNLKEEAAAAKLARIMGTPVPHFGASDKKSASHLFYGMLNENIPGMILDRVF
jgi:endonuclease-3